MHEPVTMLSGNIMWFHFIYIWFLSWIMKNIIDSYENSPSHFYTMPFPLIEEEDEDNSSL